MFLEGSPETADLEDRTPEGGFSGNIEETVVVKELETSLTEILFIGAKNMELSGFGFVEGCQV